MKLFYLNYYYMDYSASIFVVVVVYYLTCHGIHRNPDVPTIEADLLAAMCKAEVIPEDMVNDLGKVTLQYCHLTY